MPAEKSPALLRQQRGLTLGETNEGAIKSAAVAQYVTCLGLIRRTDPSRYMEALRSGHG